MMTKWIYDPNRARVSALDDGSVRIDIINVFGGTETERDEHGSLIAASHELLAACKAKARIAINSRRKNRRKTARRPIMLKQIITEILFCIGVVFGTAALLFMFLLVP
jgi:adenylylsulfate kinase-like enzyme